MTSLYHTVLPELVAVSLRHNKYYDVICCTQLVGRQSFGLNYAIVYMLQLNFIERIFTYTKSNAFDMHVIVDH
jgi:hypothetical protein